MRNCLCNMIISFDRKVSRLRKKCFLISQCRIAHWIFAHVSVVGRFGSESADGPSKNRCVSGKTSAGSYFQLLALSALAVLKCPIRQTILSMARKGQCRSCWRVHARGEISSQWAVYQSWCIISRVSKFLRVFLRNSSCNLFHNRDWHELYSCVGRCC